MQNRHEVYISVDIETSGPIPAEYSLLSLGACLVTDETQTFKALVQPISLNADPDALAVTGFTLEALAIQGQRPEIVMQEFAAWIDLVADGGTPVFVGFNAAFDWSFVNFYFHKYFHRNPFGFSALDIKALYMGQTNCAWEDTKSSRVSQHLQAKKRGTHDALEDALFQAELFNLIRDARAR